MRTFLDGKLDELMHNLFRVRQALTQLQQRASETRAAASALAQIGEALAIVREQERTLMEIQKYLSTAGLGNDELR